MKLINQILIKILGQSEVDDLHREYALIKAKYTCKYIQNHNNALIFKLDSRYDTNGFADRLRGMISTYALAKATNRPFRIDHIAPFRLDTFFIPNQVDWILKENEETYSLWKSQPIVILDYSKGSKVRFLIKKRQYHIYTNVNFIEVINKWYKKNYTHHDLFNELFRPSEYLEQSLEEYKHYINEGYISISFRFMQLMGDLKDVRGNTLSEDEQNKLADKCMAFIDKIHLLNPLEKHILVTADSLKFMQRLSTIDYVFTIPGEIGHIGHMSSNGIYLKTFQDFYMISKAKKAYLGYTGEMYKSNFAKEAARTTGIPFEAINF